MFTTPVLLNNMVQLKSKICLIVSSDIILGWRISLASVRRKMWNKNRESSGTCFALTHIIWQHTAKRRLVMSQLQGKGFGEWDIDTCCFKLWLCHSFHILLQSYHPFKEVTLFGITAKVANLSFIIFAGISFTHIRAN